MISHGYLLDTNIVSYLALARSQRPSDVSKAVLARARAIQDQAQLFICAITSGEVEYGLRIAPNANTVTQMEMRRLMQSFPIVLGLDRHVASECYSEIRSRLFQKYAPRDRKGRAQKNFIEEWLDPTTGKSLGVQENDVWLTAVALCHNLILVTNDAMDHIVTVCDGALQIENWTVIPEK